MIKSSCRSEQFSDKGIYSALRKTTPQLTFSCWISMLSSKRSEQRWTSKLKMDWSSPDHKQKTWHCQVGSHQHFYKVNNLCCSLSVHKRRQKFREVQRMINNYREKKKEKGKRNKRRRRNLMTYKQPKHGWMAARLSTIGRVLSKTFSCYRNTQRSYQYSMVPFRIASCLDIVRSNGLSLYLLKTPAISQLFSLILLQN